MKLSEPVSVSLFYGCLLLMVVVECTGYPLDIDLVLISRRSVFVAKHWDGVVWAEDVNMSLL